MAGESDFFAGHGSIFFQKLSSANLRRETPVTTLGDGQKTGKVTSSIPQLIP
jgi:hypothetical protein